jgi:hypothetical protein
MPDVTHVRCKSTRRPQGAAFAIRVRKSGRQHAAGAHDSRDIHPQFFTRIHSMSSRRIAVRRSGVHGKGVFALEPIAAGERLIEYKGERISWKEALRRHPHDPKEPNHTAR